MINRHVKRKLGTGDGGAYSAWYIDGSGYYLMMSAWSAKGVYRREHASYPDFKGRR
jgi:hypothetical protein